MPRIAYKIFLNKSRPAVKVALTRFKLSTFKSASAISHPSKYLTIFHNSFVFWKNASNLIYPRFHLKSRNHIYNINMSILQIRQRSMKSKTQINKFSTQFLTAWFRPKRKIEYLFTAKWEDRARQL